MTHLLKLKPADLAVAESRPLDYSASTTRHLADLEFQVEVDVHELLAGHRVIALLWGIEDVQEVRPDLTDEQAWEVLQNVKRHHDAEIGINWLTLETVAETLYGDAPETDEAEERP